MAGRPSHLEVLEDLATTMWAPVYKTLSEEDKVKLSSLPYDEALYASATEKDAELLASIRVSKPRAIDPSKMRWVEARDVDRLHERLVSEYGGHQGVRHPGWVAGFIDRARNSRVMGVDPLPSVFHKAAHIMREICVQHPYVDGQKRAGLAAAFVLLGLNGYALWSRNQTDEVHYAMKVAIGEFETDQIASWLSSRVGPLQLEDGSGNIVKMLGGKAREVRCWKCGQFLTQPLGRFVFCRKCKLAYEIRAKAVALAAGPGGKNIEARIGVHKIGEELRILGSDYEFLLTDASSLNLEFTRATRVRIRAPSVQTLLPR